MTSETSETSEAVAVAVIPTHKKHRETSPERVAKVSTTDPVDPIKKIAATRLGVDKLPHSALGSGCCASVFLMEDPTKVLKVSWGDRDGTKMFLQGIYEGTIKDKRFVRVYEFYDLGMYYTGAYMAVLEKLYDHELNNCDNPYNVSREKLDEFRCEAKRDLQRLAGKIGIAGTREDLHPGNVMLRVHQDKTPEFIVTDPWYILKSSHSSELLGASSVPHTRGTDFGQDPYKTKKRTTTSSKDHHDRRTDLR